MDFYSCQYVNVIPYRHGNDYCEAYQCGVTMEDCKCCQCDLTQSQIDTILNQDAKETNNNWMKY